MRSVGRKVAVFAVLAATVAGQDFPAAFRAAEDLRREVGADPKTVREAFAVALTAYLRLPAQSEAAQTHLADAAWSAWRAGDLRLATLLYEEAWKRLPHSQALAEQRLRGLLDSGAALAAIEFGKEIDREHRDVTLTVFSADHRGGDIRVLAAADALLKANRTELGLWAFACAAAGSPGSAVALANQALACRNVGMIEDSERLYRQAIALAPEDDLLHNDYALFLKGIGRVDDAIAAFRKGRELENPPGSSPAIPNLLQLQGVTRRPLLADAPRDMATVLSVRPDAAFARRLAIDLMLERHAARLARGR